MYKKILKYYLPLFLWALVIFLFSAHPQIKTSEIYWQDFILKKTAHMSEYAILNILLFRTLLNEDFKKPDAAFYSVLLSIIYAFSDEYHQLFVMGRTALIRDIVFDGVGSMLSLVLIFKVFPKLPSDLRKMMNL